MELSRHNIISHIADSNDYFIVNPLSGEADILSEVEYNKLISRQFSEEAMAKGYAVEPEAEDKLFKQKYLAFIEARDKDEVQLFYVPSYACNFGCSYCYQASYTPKPHAYDTGIIDAFFSYLGQKLAGRRKYITLFGGEPLLMMPKHRAYLDYFFEQAAKAGLEVAVVSNGYHLASYIDMLSKARIREIQLTLDGTDATHNSRRPLKGGGDTFTVISDAVDLLLARNIPVNLRMVVDKDNIGNLPDLSRYAIDKGWTAHPLFKTQLGRNYELHDCSLNSASLYSRLDLYKDLYALIKEHPHIIEFHKPAFSAASFLFEQGELPAPLFDACTGTKTEWAFDYTGHIFACTATVGKQGESLGTFYPEVHMNHDVIEEWENRDVLAITACKSCHLSLLCGGGCAAVAKNQNGTLHSPDCRPVKELLEMGIGLYFNQTKT